jgi:TatD DNase family protein
MERMLLETDAPYLAPVPHRGKRNEPAFVAETAARVAAIKGLSVDDVARITTQNAVRLFRLGSDLEGGRIAYPIRDSLYLNITNRCTLACTFCAKRKDWSVKGHYLMLEREPDTAEILACLDPVWRKYRELVFCGYGEPLLRPQIVEEVARTMKNRGMTVRVNTDGLANLVHGRDVTEALAGVVDLYSVSLNAPDAGVYASICPSRHGEQAYEAVKRFIISAKASADVVATAVAIPGLDIDAIRRVAEIELGVRFRARPFNEVG